MAAASRERATMRNFMLIWSLRKTDISLDGTDFIPAAFSELPDNLKFRQSGQFSHNAFSAGSKFPGNHKNMMRIINVFILNSDGWYEHHLKILLKYFYCYYTNPTETIQKWNIGKGQREFWINEHCMAYGISGSSVFNLPRANCHIHLLLLSKTIMSNETFVFTTKREIWLRPGCIYWGDICAVAAGRWSGVALTE